MAGRKGLLKLLGVFTVGFLAGGILLGGLILWHYSTVFRDWHYIQILDNTNTASMIRSDRQEELLKLIEENFQQILPAVNSMRGNKEFRLNALWAIQRYYQTFDINVPADIKPILDSLPPRPMTCCEIKKVQEAEPNSPPETEKSE